MDRDSRECLKRGIGLANGNAWQRWATGMLVEINGRVSRLEERSAFGRALLHNVPGWVAAAVAVAALIRTL